jgi:site-specific recombinase XerC
MNDKKKRFSEQESVKYWFETIGSARTKKNYLEQLPKFCAFLNKSPDEMIKERREQIVSTDPKTRRFIEHETIRFQNTLIEKGLGSYSARSYIRTIASFFSHNDLPLKFHRGELKPLRPKKHMKQIIDNLQVRQMYALGDVREKSLLLMLYHSALASTDISSLNVEDYDFYGAKGHLYFERYRKKTDQLTRGCFSEEAIYNVLLMLKTRNNPKEGALFTTREGTRLNERMIRITLENLAKKAGIEKFTPKDLRDSFHMELQNCDLPQQVVDSLMGWHQEGARGHYKIATQTIMTAYEKVFPRISINSYRRGKEVEDELRREISNLQVFIKDTLSSMALELKRRYDIDLTEFMRQISA